MDEIIKRFIIEEFAVLSLFISGFLYVYIKKNKYKKIIALILFLIVIDFVYSSLFLLYIYSNNRANLNNDYCFINTLKVNRGGIIHQNTYLNPYINIKEELVINFSFFNKFYSRFKIHSSENVVDLNDIYLTLDQYLPICYEDSIGAQVYFSRNQDTLYMISVLNNLKLLEKVSKTGNEAERFLYMMARPKFVKIKIANHFYCRQNLKVIPRKFDGVFYKENQLSLMDNPFIKLYRKFIIDQSYKQ